MIQNVKGGSPDSNPARLQKRGPSFLFIGPPRGGSSWFVEILREHPSVFIPRNKGTFFFSKLYGMGPSWYERFFPNDPEPAAIGEVCEDYLASPEALGRIKAYRPTMRLVCCLRNPYDRAISAWRFFARNGLDQPTLAAQAERNSDIFDHGCYATQLSVVRSLFPESRVLIFFFEEIASAPEGVARRLYQFIGVDPEFVPPSLHQRRNPGARPRSRLLARLVHDMHIRSWGSSRLLSNAAGRIKRLTGLRRLVTTVLYKENPRSDEWRESLPEFPQQIIARYEQEISALERMLGKDLSSWRASAGAPERASREQPRVRGAIRGT
jgi:hypothetical protein